MTSRVPLAALAGELQELLSEAEAAARQAYAPYSRFPVGAALRSERGAVHRGCNVENASYGATLCAERGAVTALVAAGERRIVDVAVWVPAAEPAMPCGLCRQVLWEFGPRARVVSASPSGAVVTTLGELLPQAFSLPR